MAQNYYMSPQEAARTNIAILRNAGGGSDSRKKSHFAPDASVEGDHQRIIIGITCRLMIPMIQLFSLYVVAHGHHSPGGGFQGGVMLGSSFILLAMSSDLKSALLRFSERKFLILAAVGVLIYSGIGFLCLLLEGNLLDYGILHRILPADEVMSRSHGIFGVEIGVCFTVAAVMWAIYANLSSKGRLDEGL